MRHHTSRAGDPHRHLHLQINARVFAEGRWRGLHTVGVRDSIDAINGIGHAAMMTDPASGSARRARFHPRPRHRRGRRSWPSSSVRSAPGRRRSDATSTVTRPSGAPRIRARAGSGTAAGVGSAGLGRRATGQDRAPRRRRTDLALGRRTARARATATPPTRSPVDASPVGHLDRDAAVGEVLARLGARRSAWNAADVRGEVEQLIARANVVTDAAVRRRAGRGPDRPNRRRLRPAARPRRACPNMSAP